MSWDGHGDERLREIDRMAADGPSTHGRNVDGTHDIRRQLRRAVHSWT